MTSTPEALPEDPDLLKATLLAERAESERLRQIIKELQRHRFGRRAESANQALTTVAAALGEGAIAVLPTRSFT